MIHLIVAMTVEIMREIKRGFCIDQARNVGLGNESLIGKFVQPVEPISPK